MKMASDQSDDSAAEDMCDRMGELEKNLAEKLLENGLLLKNNAKIRFIYNPLDYAKGLHQKFLQKYCDSTKKILFLGMNPGPWGMCQTGVPFGEVDAVKNFLKLNGTVGKPKKICEARPILGLACHRHEISGKRLWHLIEEVSGNARTFFKDCFVYNYLPLAFLTSAGKNVTPAELNKSDQKFINEICDTFLRDVIVLLKVKVVVAIGKFVEKRAQEAIAPLGVRIVSIPHPSPLNAKFNGGKWEIETRKLLKEFDILKHMT